jgi:hypothetical protein
MKWDDEDYTRGSDAFWAALILYGTILAAFLAYLIVR